MTTDGPEKSSVRQVGWGNDAAPVRQRTFEEPKLMILTLALALHIPAIGEQSPRCSQLLTRWLETVNHARSPLQTGRKTILNSAALRHKTVPLDR